MATEDEDKSEGGEEEQLDPAVVIKELESRAKNNSIMLMIALFLVIVGFCVMATGLSVVYIKVTAIEEVPEDDIESQVKKIYLQLEEIEQFKNDEILTITEFEDKINLLQDDYQSKKVIAVKKVLMDREADYQRLIESLRNSAESLSSMIMGPREWVDFYKEEMNILKKRSNSRSSVIESTLPDEVMDGEEQADDEEK